jgi:hypothetical protein
LFPMGAPKCTRQMQPLRPEGVVVSFGVLVFTSVGVVDFVRHLAEAWARREPPSVLRRFVKISNKFVATWVARVAHEPSREARGRSMGTLTFPVIRLFVASPQGGRGGSRRATLDGQ